jgi:hypothetical protein
MMMNNTRRQLCKGLVGLPWVGGLVACAQTLATPVRIYTEEEQRRMNKFANVMSTELLMSSLDQLRWIAVLDQNNRYVHAPSLLSPSHGSGFPLREVPARLRLTWREQDPNNPVYSGNRNESWSGGKITGSFEIPVADRIPDELLDDLRRDPKGSLRIKVRLHRDGVLLGWDIERRPGYDRKNRDIFGQAVYVAAEHSFYGGDFREAEIINGKPVRMGWYIHPKTGQRIETPY